MSYNNRGPPGSNGRRPDLQQYPPALTARTQDTFSASTAQNSYNRDSPALTARTQNRSSASTTPSSSQRDPALTARTQSSSSASTTRLQQASSTPGYAGGNGHPLIDVESMSPDRILRLLREYRLIKVLVYSNNATALTFQVVDDRAHDAMAKLLREKQVRIIPGGFRVQQ